MPTTLKLRIESQVKFVKFVKFVNISDSWSELRREFVPRRGEFMKMKKCNRIGLIAE